MNTKLRNTIQSAAATFAVLAAMVLLAGCDRADQNAGSTETQAHDRQSSGDQRPMSHVVESADFTLRANVSRTDVLPDAMARQYQIEPEPDLFLLNLVILAKQPDQQPEPVSAEVSVELESLIGHVETIDMRAVESDGHVTYIGTLDARAQRSFKLVIEAQPAGSSQPLQMDFEIQLESFDLGDSE